MATGRVPTTANSPLTAKGDLFTYSTAPARLAVGNNGETIVADSSTSTGLRYQANFAAGKNKIINGDFGIWQRGTTFASGGYTADRWTVDYAGGAGTTSQQTFTAGTAPVAGYEGIYFLRKSVTTGAQFGALIQRIEDVRTFAGQTVTLSFWAKGTNPTGDFRANLIQNFGSGGSADVSNTAQTLTLTGSWTRYSFTFTLASIAGKTIGASSYLFISIYQGLSNTSASTLDIWGVQLEAGSVATAFQTATGTIQGELAACQRYYYRWSAGSIFSQACLTTARGNTLTDGVLPQPVTMRTTPTSIDFASLLLSTAAGGSTAAITAMALNQPGASSLAFTTTTASNFSTSGAALQIIANSTTSAFIAFSAEL